MYIYIYIHNIKSYIYLNVFKYDLKLEFLVTYQNAFQRFRDRTLIRIDKNEETAALINAEDEYDETSEDKMCFKTEFNEVNKKYKQVMRNFGYFILTLFIINLVNIGFGIYITIVNWLKKYECHVSLWYQTHYIIEACYFFGLFFVIYYLLWKNNRYIYTFYYDLTHNYVLKKNVKYCKIKDNVYEDITFMEIQYFLDSQHHKHSPFAIHLGCYTICPTTNMITFLIISVSIPVINHVIHFAL